VTKYAGSDWLKKQTKSIPEVSELGANVADILGQVFQGIYHLDNTTLYKTNWADTHMIEVLIRNELATFDFSHLTYLMVLCFDQDIRLAINPCNMQFIKLQFTQRTPEGPEKHMFERIPTLEKSIIQARHYLGLPTQPQNDQKTLINGMDEVFNHAKLKALHKLNPEQGYVADPWNTDTSFLHQRLNEEIMEFKDSNDPNEVLDIINLAAFLYKAMVKDAITKLANELKRERGEAA